MLLPKGLLRFLFSVFLLCFAAGAMAQNKATAKCDSILMSGVEALNKNEHMHSLELLTKALALSRSNDWPNQEFLALNNIGANYYLLLEYGEALNYYLEAYTVAIKKLEPKDEMIVLNNIAILYSKEKKYDKANEYFNKAYGIAKENKDDFRMGLYALNMGNLANESNNYKLGKDYFTESLPLLVSQPQFLVLAKIGLGDCDIALGNPKRARESATELLRTTKDLEFNHTGISLCMIISRAFLKENQLDEALDYAKKTLERKPNLETKLQVFGLLSEIHFKKKNYAAALQYKDSIINTNLELDKIKNNKLYENSKVKLEIQNYKNQSERNESKLVSERRIFYSVLLSIIIIVIFVVWTLRNLSLKHKQKKLIAERNEQILVLELEKEKRELLLLEKQFNENSTLSLLEQERLKNEVELKNRKLSAKALYLSGRNIMIEEVLSGLTDLLHGSKNNSLIEYIQTLKNHLRTDNEWDSFITHFEEVNQGFLTSLKTKHPNLTSNDIRFLSYIYMNLSTKEIASMLNITQDSCRKRKERISTKMELEKDVNLYDYLASMQ
ncbi:tetratricopeptide repeat protein [Flavobacterium humi]|uniref:Tetratricopeptide repeat protein n=1 Tax=Flavobacterium humi TaxID=2562683 RepID=A0A4Z0L4M6_9FLAO|nr:tetratricopeptide repeat protein [Flavobacterium humi]TGD56916.1 tetratricopeptide repeat protein [Flavobacterium humi]